MNQSQINRLALVIGSGAVKCAAALGVWKALNLPGIEVDLLVGCSGGSLFAITMPLGYSVMELQLPYLQLLLNENHSS